MLDSCLPLHCNRTFVIIVKYHVCAFKESLCEIVKRAKLDYYS